MIKGELQGHKIVAKDMDDFKRQVNELEKKLFAFPDDEETDMTEEQWIENCKNMINEGANMCTSCGCKKKSKPKPKSKGKGKKKVGWCSQVVKAVVCKTTIRRFDPAHQLMESI